MQKASEELAWSDMDTLLLLEGLDLYGDNWADISDHVGTKSQVGSPLRHSLGIFLHEGMTILPQVLSSSLQSHCAIVIFSVHIQSAETTDSQQAHTPLAISKL